MSRYNIFISVAVLALVAIAALLTYAHVTGALQ